MFNDDRASEDTPFNRFLYTWPAIAVLMILVGLGYLFSMYVLHR